eukprot:1093417-Amphidinium_carterae.1
MKELMQCADIHKLGWEHFNSASFADLLDKAKAEHEAGQLFRGKEGYHAAEVAEDIECDAEAISAGMSSLMRCLWSRRWRPSAQP